MSRKIHMAPIAVATDGAVIANVAGFGPTTIEGLLAHAVDDDAELFIGIVVDGEDRQLVLERLDNAAAEAVAKIYGRRGGR